MSSANRPPDPQAAPQTSVPTTDLLTTLDQALALSLHLWPALSLAVQNNWGGPSSADKRSWFAGALSDIFASSPDTDADDVEEVLLQVMLDEFEVVVDDGSARDVAEEIVRTRKAVLTGDRSGVQKLEQTWERRRGKKVEGDFKRVERAEDEDETDWDDEDDDGEEDGDEDEEMDEAPPLVEVRPKQRMEPEVDEEGFTKVIKKGRR